MHVRRLVLLTTLTVLACAPAPRSGYRGLVVGLHSLEPGHDYGPQLEEARRLGANSVSFMVALDMAHVGSAELGPTLVSEETLARAMEQARALHLSLVLLPYIRLQRLADGEWRGTLRPSDPELWWASYTERMVELARLAEREGVSLFSVGSELCSLEGERERWRELLRQVRLHYGGEVTYSANWDHLEPVSFAEELDLVGMNTYYELGREGDTSPEALAAAWARLKPAILAWVERTGKPLVFTEVGYPSIEGGLRWPWDYTREAPVDLEAQRRGYEAFLNAWWGEPAVRGIFFYELWGEGGPGDGGYTPRGKPAARVLARYYRGRSW